MNEQAIHRSCATHFLSQFGACVLLFDDNRSSDSIAAAASPNQRIQEYGFALTSGPFSRMQFVRGRLVVVRLSALALQRPCKTLTLPAPVQTHSSHTAHTQLTQQLLAAPTRRHCPKEMARPPPARHLFESRALLVALLDQSPVTMQHT